MISSSNKAIPVFAAVTAAAVIFALAGISPWDRWPPAALWHLVFAVGALPMILAAMSYFVPVLTRTREAPRALAALPLAALLTGISIVVWFVHGDEIARVGTPWIALAVIAGFAVWMGRRRRACLGRAHPCLRWYAAALACLGLGLASVGASPWLPEHAPALRLFHLHINTLGFMGLTAIGTLQVLLPTVVGKPDPAAVTRLVRDLPWSLGGTLCIAIGSAWALWPLAISGAIAYGWPLARLARDFYRLADTGVFAPRQATPLLLAAGCGLALALLHGLAHGAGWIGARGALPLFVIGFLLPLVSGAVAQLLPLWLRSGAQGEWHRAVRTRLTFGAKTRAAALLIAGPLAAAGHVSGYGIGIAAALWLLAVMAWLTFRHSH